MIIHNQSRGSSRERERGRRMFEIKLYRRLEEVKQTCTNRRIGSTDI